MRCIGSHLRLKKRFGAGYKIHFTVSSELQMERANAFVLQVLEKNHPRELVRYRFSATVISLIDLQFGFKAKKGELSDIFEKLQLEQTEHGIDVWGISQTSLEEVFMNVISDKDANAE